MTTSVNISFCHVTFQHACTYY